MIEVPYLDLIYVNDGIASIENRLLRPAKKGSALLSNASKSRTALVRFALGLVSLTLALTAAATAESPFAGVKTEHRNAVSSQTPTAQADKSGHAANPSGISSAAISKSEKLDAQKTMTTEQSAAKNARLAEHPTGEKMIPPPKMTTEREQIEKCLVEIYVAQTSYFAENNRYAGNRRVLGLFDEGYCKTLKLNFKEVKTDSYVVTAESAKERWMINEAKEIFQLK